MTSREYVPGLREGQFQQKVIEIIKAKSAKLKCPVCKKLDWTGNAIVCLAAAEVKAASPDRFYLATDQNPSQEFVVPLRCGNCGYTILFSADQATQDSAAGEIK